jgi:hypothetical protein
VSSTQTAPARAAVDEIKTPTTDAPRDDTGEEERWGSGEVVLSRVILVDSRGDELVALGPGTPVSR